MDRSGGLLALGLTCWLVGANLVSGGSPIGPVVLVAGVALAYVLGRSLGRWRRFVPASVVIVVTLVSFAFAWPDVIGHEPIAQPLGYQNANAALAVQAFVAASMIVVARNAVSTGIRILAAVVALSVLLVPIVVGASAATAGVVLVVVVGSWAMLRGRRSIASLLVAGVVVVVTATVIAGTIYAGSNDDPDRVEPTTAVATRVSLWADALGMVAAHPIVGIGSGRFADESPTARADPDRRYAHQEFLQTAAETGVVGGVLALILFIWAIAWTASRGTPEGAVVAAGVAALAVHASVDYVLHFPIVPIAAAALVGGALARRSEPEGARDVRAEDQEVAAHG
jgi:O-antigen ligase